MRKSLHSTLVIYFCIKSHSLSMRLFKNTTFLFKSLCPPDILRPVKMWDKRWEFGAGDLSSRLPRGQFTQRPADKGHFKHSALMATDAEGFASASHSIPPLVQHWLQHCVMLPPSWADILLQQHCLYKANEAWTAVQWWMWGQPLASVLLSLIVDQFCCSNGQLTSFSIRADMISWLINWSIDS